MIMVQSDQTASDEEQFGAVGMCVVSDLAIAAGIGSIPDPVSDEASELWFLHQAFMASMIGGTEFGIRSTTFEFDSRAMRKVDDSKSIVVVVENISSVGLQYLMHFRMLVKLHR